MGVLIAPSRRWHRRLAVVAGVAVLLWAGSGLLHPVMSWTNPRPTTLKSPASESAMPDLKTVRTTRGDERITRLRAVQLPEGPALQFTTDANIERVYSLPGSDRLREQGDRDYAIQLARHYSGEFRATVFRAEHVTAFDRRYPSVNRVLPAWRVEFDRPDRLSVYVDTATDRLLALNDRRKEILQAIFLHVHKLDFLSPVEPLRIAVVGMFGLSVLVMALLGLRLLFAPRTSRATTGRRVHRWLGLVAVPAVLMLSVSGLFHLPVTSSWRWDSKEPRHVSGLSLEDVRLHAPSAAATALLSPAPNVAVWRTQQGNAVEFWDAKSGEHIARDEAAFARWLARIWGYSTASDKALLVTGFSDEYGFANKRLPVWRVPLEEGHALFVDVREGVVAAHVGALDRAQLWSFSTLHKWQFLNPLGREWRDGILAGFAILIWVLSAAGWRLLKPCPPALWRRRLRML